MKIAIIGGTGLIGRGLAARWSKRHEIVIGSRDRSRAQDAARSVSGASGMDIGEAAAACDAALLAIPFEAVAGVAKLAESLASKLVISPINPLRRDGRVFHYALEVGSAAEAVAEALPESRVAAAFNTIPASFFARRGGPELDVPVAADGKGTYEETASLIREAGALRPLYAGPLSQARYTERMVPLLLNLQRFNAGKSYSAKFVEEGRKDGL